MVEFSSGLFLSPTGRIWSNKSRIWRKLPCNGAGYLNISCPEGTFYVHRLMAQEYLGPCPGPKYVVHHKNGRRGDNFPENLVWATQKANKKAPTPPTYLIFDGTRHYISDTKPDNAFSGLVFEWRGGNFQEIHQNISLPAIKTTP